MDSYLRFRMPNNRSRTQQDVDEANLAHAQRCLRAEQDHIETTRSLLDCGMAFVDAQTYVRTALRMIIVEGHK